MNKDIQDIVFVELEDLRGRISDNILSTGRNVSGRTIQRMHTEKTETGATLFGRRAFGTLETGRKPGKVPPGFYHIIRQWVIDKGISFDSVSKRNSFAYLVSRKIAKEGTKLHRDGGSSDVYSKEVPVTVKRVKDRLGQLVKMEVEHINLNK